MSTRQELKAILKATKYKGKTPLKALYNFYNKMNSAEKVVFMAKMRQTVKEQSAQELNKSI